MNAKRWTTAESANYRVTEWKSGCVLVERKRDGCSVFFQIGDDANVFLDDLSSAVDAPGFGDENEAIDVVCSQYDDVMSPPPS